MHSSKIAIAVIVFGISTLAASAADAQTQMDQRCARAVEFEVRGRYPQAARVAATALQGRRVAELEMAFSGAGHFEAEDGARTPFLFECVSSARTGQAYGVNIRHAPGGQNALVQSFAETGRVRPPSEGEASAAEEAWAETDLLGAKDVAASAEPTPAMMMASAPTLERAAEIVEAALPQSQDECAPDTLTPCTMTPQPASPAAATPAISPADAALAAVAPDLPRGQVALLRFAARATAAASVCPNMELNTQAVLGTVTNVVQAMSMDLSEDEGAQRRDAALVGYGVLSGQMLQEAAANPTEFCANAAGAARRARSWSFVRLSE